ncbi:MAG: EAL domain-containing protein [Burkholderiaceae bacterium]
MRLLSAGLLFLAMTGAALAQALSGSPPVSILRPDVGAPPSSLDIAQDDSSLLYVANGGGVLTFDGETWQLLRLPNGDSSTSVTFDGHSRVYVGGHDLIGYFEKDENGLPDFHDLTANFTQDLDGQSFGDVYSIRVTKDGVFFESTYYVFLYSPASQRSRIWRHPGRLGAMDIIDNEVWLQFRGEGLKRFADGDWKAVPGSGPLSLLSNSLLPLPDGGVISMTSDGSWKEWSHGRSRDYEMPAGFPSASEFNAALLLRDGSYALGAIDGTLWLYQPRTRRFKSMHVSDGPLNGLSLSNDGGLLAVSDLAAFHISWPGDWTSLTHRDGISGTIHRLRNWNGRWLALSSSGVYSSANATETVASYRRLRYTDYDAFDMIVVNGGHALLAENFRLLWVDESQVLHSIGRPDLYPRLLVRSPSHSDQIYVGTEYGVGILEATKKEWRFRLDRGEREERVESLVELSPTEILVGTTRHGLRRIRFDADRQTVEEDRLLGEAEGMHYGQIPRAQISRLADGTILASTEAGLFRWNHDRFEATTLPGLELPATLAPILTFAAGPSGEWAFGGELIFHRAVDAKWSSEQIGNVVSGYVESIGFDSDQITLFGCASAILIHENLGRVPQARPPQIQMRSVESIAPTGLDKILPLAPSEPISLAHDAGILLHVALPEFSGLGPSLYQTRLSGPDGSVSKWQHSNSYRLTHLLPGEYSLQVAGRDRLGRISETPPFRFVILEPWYARTWAQLLWIVLAILLISGLIYVAIAWRTIWLNRKRVELERVVSDRTRELVKANDRLNELAHRDTLTGLANRALFERRLEQARASALRHETRFAVLFIDLDQFKTINDSLGHEAGDRLLKEVSARLSARLRREDTLARWGGDEFMVLAEDLHSTADVAVIAQTLLETASAPIALSGNAVAALSTSVGVSMYPDDATNVNELIRNADTAMYSAKNRGGNQWCFYASEMTSIARERLEILNGLRVAAEQGDFVLHYQPIVEVQSGRIIGAEALLRWEKAPGQIISPETFIAIAESTDLISTIGAWVIRTACQQGRHWFAGNPDFTLAINISPRQLRNAELVRVVEQALAEFSIDPSRLILEVTESSIAEAGEDAQSIINELKSLGVRIAVDDFGTGQSALASLKRFEFDALKIDRSFIRDTPRDVDDMEISATIVAMGHALGLIVVAEGVETEEQLNFLKDCGCDHYQGFFYSAAIPAAEMTERLRLVSESSTAGG